MTDLQAICLMLIFFNADHAGTVNYFFDSKRCFYVSFNLCQTSGVLEDLCFLMLGSLQKSEVNIIHAHMQSTHTEDFTNILHIIANLCIFVY